MHSDLISRPRVERQLRETVERTPLTLLHAPLGSGKTAAATLAFADRRRVVWMEARPWHRGAFIRAIVDAVRDARADFGRMTLGAMDAGAGLAHIGRVFARELGHNEEPLLVIVDNVHVFSAEPGFASFVGVAVNALPANVHILAMGRSLPQVTIGSTFARGRAQILGGDFLTFDADDVRALGRHFGRDLGDRSVSQILESTEGWAAGVTLAVTAERVPVPTATRPRAAAEAYLTKELLARLDRDGVSFLERAAVFETLDVKILQGGAAFARARERISDLQRSGAPLSQIGPDQYRLHPVLRELGEARLRKRGAASEAHRDAATAYANAGEIAAALFHVDAADDAPLAASFLRDHAEAAIATGDHARVRAVAARIDAGGGDAGVRWYLDALVEKARGSADVRSGLEHAAAAADASGDDAIAFSARAQIVERDLSHLIRVGDDALEDLSRRAQARGAAAAATAAVLRGWARAIANDFTGALGSVSSLATSNDPSLRFSTDILKAYAQTSLGRADIALEILDALTRLLEGGDRVVLQTLTLVWFARVALVWGHTNAASDAAAQAERLAGALDLRTEEAAMYVALAEIASHHGDVGATVRYAERAGNRAERAWYAGDVNRIRAFAQIALARAAFLGHDNAIARELAERAAAGPDVPAVQRAVALTEAAVYTLLCDPSASPGPIARARDAIAHAMPIDAADAVALATADDVLAFLDAANGTVHASSLSGLEVFGALIEQRRGLVTLEHAGIAVGNARRGTTGSSAAFDTALELLNRDGPRFEARLARAYAAGFIKPKRVAPTARELDLTAREREILALLVDGLSNKEIAQRLVLSPRTIETHVERVLGKLGVGSRSRAIAKAIRLGLVVFEGSASG